MNGLNKQGGVDFEIIFKTWDSKSFTMGETHMEINSITVDYHHCYNDFVC